VANQKKRQLWHNRTAARLQWGFASIHQEGSMKASALMLLTAILVSGCTTRVPGHLYPLRGPLAAQNPPPILAVSLHGGLAAPLVISTTLENGDVCKSRVTRVRKADTSANQMAAQWDSVYGQGFFAAHVLGNYSFARSALTCPGGTTVSLQFYEARAEDIQTAAGVAQDSKGNLYKLTF
jgi:hypothetical protein